MTDTDSHTSNPTTPNIEQREAAQADPWKEPLAEHKALADEARSWAAAGHFSSDIAGANDLIQRLAEALVTAARDVRDHDEIRCYLAYLDQRDWAREQAETKERARQAGAGARPDPRYDYSAQADDGLPF